MPKYCIKCGSEVDGLTKFCTECGAKLTDETTQQRPVSSNVQILSHIHFMMKAYLVLGIVSILVTLSLLFGFRIANGIILTGEILIILGGVFLIISYELIFKGKKYVASATLGCVCGLFGSFFPTVESLKQWYEYSDSIVFPIMFFIIFFVYLLFLIATLLWRPKYKDVKEGRKFISLKK